MKKIVIAEFMNAQAVAFLSERFDVRYEETLVDDQPRLLGSLEDADGLIVRNRTQVNAALLVAAPVLRVVGRLGVGLDNIDVGACRERGIEVIPATGANSQSVAEYVIAATIFLLRRVYASSAEVARGNWPRQALSDGCEVAGKTMGVVGFGGIGRLVARYARALGMEVLAHDPLVLASSPAFGEVGAKPMALESLLADSDVVSLHVPLEDSTRNLIDAKRLARMKPGAILVNTARGGIVDEAALVSALRAGRLGGAAIDVFEREPLPAGSAIGAAAGALRNLILTPHVAGVTRESNARIGALVAERVAAALGV